MNEAENINAEGTAEQESPTTEINQTESENSETAEKLEKTPESQEEVASKEAVSERNWKALREENERLKGRLGTQTSVEVNPLQSGVKSELGLLLSPDDKTEVRLNEMRAEEAFPELETDTIFQRAVVGDYLKSLAEYNQTVMQGRQATLPNAYKIAKNVKKEFDERFGEVSKRAEAEGAKKAQKAKESKQATTEAEGRSDRGRTLSSTEELTALRVKSREGSLDSVVERLERSKL